MEVSPQKKRPSDKSYSSPISKRSRTSFSPSRTHIDAFFESPKKSSIKIDPESTPSSPKEKTGHMLHIKDNKTRQNPYLPREPDMYSGKLQLMIYRKLLCELLATDTPYQFSRVWEKVGVDSAEVFPTKFLVQARLIEETSEFQICCLDDIVELWHKTVKEMNIVGVDHTLELVYRLRRPPDLKQKKKSKTPSQLSFVNQEDSDLAKAIAASLNDHEQYLVNSNENEAGPSNWNPTEDLTVIDLTTPTADSEEMQLQWALQHSATQLIGGPGPGWLVH